MRRALAALCLLLAACAPQGGNGNSDGTAPGPLLPQLAARQDQVERLRLRGAGGRVLVSLHRERGEWRLAERADASADAARIAQYLLLLAQARRIEPKTGSPAMYPRLGVEDVADVDAGGHELELAGRGVDARIVLGKAHRGTGHSYVRLHGQKRSWLLDVDAGFDPDPRTWLQRRLLEVPLARVERVRIRPREGGDFALSRRDDRFRPEDAPAAAVGDSLAGDRIAAALDGLEVEDAGTDPGRPASRALDFELVDGATLGIEVWRDGPRDWARISARLDPARAQAWARQAGKPGLPAAARAQVAEWNRRFAGRSYLLPQELASTLMLDYERILRGEPGMAPP